MEEAVVITATADVSMGMIADIAAEDKDGTDKVVECVAAGAATAERAIAGMKDTTNRGITKTAIIRMATTKVVVTTNTMDKAARTIMEVAEVAAGNCGIA
jgi:hypothetical protein